jgi:hypothetical protein
LSVEVAERLAVSRRSWCLKPGQFRNPEERGISFVGSCYKAAFSEDLVDFMCAVDTGSLQCVIQ